MKITSATLISIAAMSFLLGGCCGKKNNTTTSAQGAAAAVQTKNEVKKAIKGRCDNETTDSPYGSIYFYPENREMFFTLVGMAIRVPVDVSGEAGADGKVSFGYKWVKDKQVLTESATVGWVGSSKLNFDFDTIKDSICHPVVDDNFYKKLSEFGVKADKYLDAKNRDFMIFQADSQKILNEVKKETIQWFYRIRSKTDAGITIYASSTPPTQDRSIEWAEWNISVMGDDIVIRYNDKLTRKYSLVK